MYSQKKIKICFVISSLINSGPTNVLLNTVKYLDKTQFDIHIITLFKESKHSKLSDFKKLQVTLCLRTHGKKNILSSYIEIRSLLKKIKPNVAHSHCFFSLMYLTYIRGAFKKIHTLHGYPNEFYLIKYGPKIGRLMVYFSFRGYEKMDKVISCAKHFEKKIQKNERIKTIVISNGVDTTIFAPVSPEKKAALKKNAGYENKVVYLMNNRLSAEKNNSFVINSFPKNGNARLIIIGDGNERNGLDTLTKSNVSWVKYADSVLQYLQISDYYISASKTEGLPLSVLEAMSCGLSPILSDIPAHREIISSLENFLMFSLDSKEGLRETIENTCNWIPQFSSQIRCHIKSNFSAIEMANFHREMYRELINQN